MGKSQAPGSKAGKRNSVLGKEIDATDESFGEAPGHDALMDTVQLQRRRLSLHPTLVGDVDGVRVNPSLSPTSPRRMSLGPMLLDQDMGELVQGVDAFSKDEDTTFSTRHVAMTKKGVVAYNRRKVNQDTYVVSENIFATEDSANRVDVYGVLDGHGEFGHHVSGFVAERIVPGLIELGQDTVLDDPSTAIKGVLAGICDRLKASRINSEFSGTTLVVSLKIGNTLITANIGDSRVIVGSRDGVAPLSSDHNPDVPEEKSRIIESGGRVKTLPGPPNQDLGPMRVWLGDLEIPGLAMSRSIGDGVAHRAGVINIPEITTYELKENDVFVLWATDGVWEFMKNEEVDTIVQKALPDLQVATNLVVQRSVKLWNQSEPVVDDITCVVLAIE